MAAPLPGIAAPASDYDLSRALETDELPAGTTAIPIGATFRPGGTLGGHEPWVIADLLDDGRVEIRQARDGARNRVRWVQPWEIDSFLMFDSTKVFRHPELGAVDGWSGVGLVPRDGSARAYDLAGTRVWRSREHAVRETLEHRPPVAVVHHGPYAHANLARLAARSTYVIDASDPKQVATEATGAGRTREIAAEVAAALAHLKSRFGWDGWNDRGGVMRVEINRAGEHARADALRDGTLVFGEHGYARDRSVVMHELAHVVMGCILGSYVPGHVRFDELGPEQLRPIIEASSVDEGFADVLGACYARTWKIGAGVPGGPIRDIATRKGIDTHLSRVRAALERDPRRCDPHRFGGVLSRAAWHMKQAPKPSALSWDDIEALYFHAIPKMEAFTFEAANAALSQTALELFGDGSLRHRTVLKSLARVGLD